MLDKLGISAQVQVRDGSGLAWNTMTTLEMTKKFKVCFEVTVDEHFLMVVVD